MVRVKVKEVTLPQRKKKHMLYPAFLAIDLKCSCWVEIRRAGVPRKSLLGCLSCGFWQSVWKMAIPEWKIITQVYQTQSVSNKNSANTMREGYRQSTKHFSSNNKENRKGRWRRRLFFLESRVSLVWNWGSKAGEFPSGYQFRVRHGAYLNRIYST